MRTSYAAVATYPFILDHIGRTVRIREAIVNQVDVDFVVMWDHKNIYSR
jgi:hypothetical protein